MVAATPVFKECKLGKGVVIDSYRGCVIDIFDKHGRNPMRCDTESCTCYSGQCKAETQTTANDATIGDTYGD